jgi:hypothetical protein
MSISNLEFTIPSDLEGPNERTAEIIAEAFVLALYGNKPGDEVQRKEPAEPVRIICGKGANNYVLHVEDGKYRFHARDSVPAWLGDWLTHRFGAKVRVTRAI